MIRKLSFGWLGLLLLGLASCHSSSDKEQKQAVTPEVQQRQYYKRFKGDIDGHSTVLHLIKYASSAHRAMSDNELQYNGTLIMNQDSAPLMISGYRENDSVVTLVAYQQVTPVDTLTGQFLNGIFQGVRTDENGSTSRFKLHTDYSDGSHRWQVATYRDSVKVDSLGKRSTPKAIVDLMTLWPARDKSYPAFQDTVSRSFYGRNDHFPSATKLLRTSSDSFFTKYRQAVDKISSRFKNPGPTLDWTYLAYMNMTYNRKDTVSGIFTNYKFLGGAHGLQTEVGYAFDLNTGKAVHLSNLFEKGYQQRLQRVLEAKFRRQYDIPEGTPLNGKSGLLFDSHLKITSNFYLTSHGIGFIYNPYEVAPYVVGIIDLYVPYSEIEGLLKRK